MAKRVADVLPERQSEGTPWRTEPTEDATLARADFTARTILDMIEWKNRRYQLLYRTVMLGRL